MVFKFWIACHIISIITIKNTTIMSKKTAKQILPFVLLAAVAMQQCL
jgi:hypothetical protein